MTAQGSPAKMKELRLPISRVKTIMKSSPYVDTIGQDGLFLVTKATELFIHYLTEEAHLRSNKGHSLDYKHLAEVVQTNDTLEFLREIMPRKITVRQFKEMMAAKNSHTSSESSSDSDSDSESDTDSCSDSEDRKGNNRIDNDEDEDNDDDDDDDDDEDDDDDDDVEDDDDDDDDDHHDSSGSEKENEIQENGKSSRSSGKSDSEDETNR